MDLSRVCLSPEASCPQQGGSLILFGGSCHRSSLCCKRDSVTETNTGRELRSRFLFSVLQTRRNENNVCNLNKINLNAPEGSGGLFLGCKHCHPDFGNDRLKVQSGLEVRLWPCRIRALSLAERWKQTSVGSFLPSHRLQADCSCTLLAKTPVLRGDSGQTRLLRIFAIPGSPVAAGGARLAGGAGAVGRVDPAAWLCPWPVVITSRCERHLPAQGTAPSA